MIKRMRTRLAFIAIGVAAGLVVNALTALAWTGPTASPPGNNVAAPVNVGTTAQVKNGDVGVNNFSAFGNALLSGLGVGTGRYLNFDYTSGGTSGAGTAGYGIRDNAGTLEFKNLGGTWQSLQAFVAALGAGTWTTSGNNIYNANTGNVGIGVTSPFAKLDLQANPSQPTTVGSYASWPVLRFRQSNASAYGVDIGVDNAVNGALLFSGVNNGVVTPGVFTIDRGGQIGVGQTVPNARFDVSSNGGSDGITMKQTSDNSEDIQTYIDGHYADRTTYAGGCCNSLALQPDVGFVGIGTRGPGYMLDVNGTAHTAGLLTASAGLNETGRMNVTGNANDWGEVINWPYGSVTGGYGILVGHAAGHYSQFQNVEGYYTLLAYSSWGLYSNGNIGAAGFYYVSDARFKNNVKNLDQGLLTLLKLRPVSFTWNEKDPNGRNGKNDIGFIAQEVEKIVPDAVNTDPNTGFKSVDYPRLVPILVKAVQEQQAEIDELKAEVKALSH